MGDYPPDECFFPLWAGVGCGVDSATSHQHDTDKIAPHPAQRSSSSFQRRDMANGLTRLKTLTIFERGESSRSLEMAREMTLIIKPALAGNLRQTQIAALEQMPDHPHPNLAQVSTGCDAESLGKITLQLADR